MLAKTVDLVNPKDHRSKLSIGMFKIYFKLFRYSSTTVAYCRTLLTHAHATAIVIHFPKFVTMGWGGGK